MCFPLRWASLAVVVIASLVSGNAAAQVIDLSSKYDGLEAGAEAYRYHEDRRQAAIARQLELNDVLGDRAAYGYGLAPYYPTADYPVAGYTLSGHPVAGYPVAGYDTPAYPVGIDPSTVVPSTVVPSADVRVRDDVYVTSRRGLFRNRRRVDVVRSVEVAPPRAAVRPPFSPPTVPPRVPQPVGHLSVEVSPSRSEYHPLYEGPARVRAGFTSRERGPTEYFDQRGPAPVDRGNSTEASPRRLDNTLRENSVTRPSAGRNGDEPEQLPEPKQNGPTADEGGPPPIPEQEQFELSGSIKARPATTGGGLQLVDPREATPPTPKKTRSTRAF